MTFDWDDANILHLARHNITPKEAEQVIANDPMDLEVQTVDGETRYPQVGRTGNGKVLTIVSTIRGSRVRVITGWDATKTERTLYMLYVLGKGY